MFYLDIRKPERSSRNSREIKVDKYQKNKRL